MTRHPFSLLAHFRPGDVDGVVLAATGDLLIAQLDDGGWSTDWLHPGGLPDGRLGLWVIEGVLIPDDDDLDVQCRWRRPTPEELGRLTEGVPVWESEEDCPEHCRKLAGAWERGPRWTLIRRSDHGTVAVVEELWGSDGRTNRWVWSCGTFTDGKQYRRADACQSKADAHLRSLGYELEEDGGDR